MGAEAVSTGPAGAGERGADLGAATWTEVRASGAQTAGRLLLVPVGSLEQHGPHLPLGTDTRIAVALAEAAAPVLGAQTGPPVAYGASGEHEGFPGTVSIGSEALARTLIELGRSACRWAPRLLLVNGHGGNVSALAAAVKLLRVEGRDVCWWTPIIDGGDAHAGRSETAMMAHLHPESVRWDRLAPGRTEPLGELWDELRAGGTAAVSPSGVLGDPTGADAVTGARLVAGLVADLTAAATSWSPDETGRVR